MPVVSSKGQITIPIAVRHSLGLRPGTAVRFELRREGVLLRKAAAGGDPVDRLYGSIRLPRSVDDLIGEMRGSRRP